MAILSVEFDPEATPNEQLELKYLGARMVGCSVNPARVDLYIVDVDSPREFYRAFKRSSLSTRAKLLIGKCPAFTVFDS